MSKIKHDNGEGLADFMAGYSTAFRRCNRRFGVTGCGPDIFFYAPLVRTTLHREETCTVTAR